MTVVSTVEGGEAVVGHIIASDLRLILFTGGNSGALTKLSDIFTNQPADGWYSEIPLPYAGWYGSGDSRYFAEQSFVSDGGSTSVEGHCIYSAVDGAIVLLDEYASPVVMSNGVSIDISPSIAVA